MVNLIFTVQPKIILTASQVIRNLVPLGLSKSNKASDNVVFVVNSK
jgi:hypothetical protein